MAITSASTQAEIVGQYLDNLDYDNNASASQCKLFIAACRALLVMHPANWSQGSVTIQYDPTLWQAQLNEARNWINANGASQSSSGVSHLSFGEGFR